MSDGATHATSLSPHKARQPRRSSPLPQSGVGRGSDSHSRSKNKTWVSNAARSHTPSPAPEGKWERGGNRSRGRGTHASNGRVSRLAQSADVSGDEGAVTKEAGPASRTFETTAVQQNGATKTWEELVKAREEERTRAIREGKMDDPVKPKRLEDAITIVGTCQDMCPEFERYRRERENNLDKWECITGPDGKPTRKVDHARAVKMYERGQGDKIIPSDLRPAPVLKRTLDYLFHELLPRGGFPETQAFVRDRSRAVRNDFTIQQDTGPIAIECHERCARFHILSLHLMSGVPGFDGTLETQQLMNSLLSLKEFYDDQRGKYESPNELEMRVYHRLGLIRDVRARNDQAPPHIAADPAFQLINRFRAQVQEASQPIMKYTKLKVSQGAMQTFAELVGVLKERRNTVMIYLIACFLENIFGKDTIDDIDSLRGSLSILDIIDGNSEEDRQTEGSEEIQDEEMEEDGNGGGEMDELSAFIEDDVDEAEEQGGAQQEGIGQVEEPDAPLLSPLKRGATQWLNENFGAAPTPPKSDVQTGFPIPSSSSGLSSVPTNSPFGSGTIPPSSTNTFGTLPSSSSAPSMGSGFNKLVGSSTVPRALGTVSGPTSVFGNVKSAFGGSPFGSHKNIFGGPVFGSSSKGIFPSEKAEEQTKSSSMPTPLSELPQPKPSSEPFKLPKGVFTSRSLADAAPLTSEGEDDKLPESEQINATPPPPFALPQPAIPTSSTFPPTRAPTNLNPSAAPFVPLTNQPTLTFTPPGPSTSTPPAPRANLTPLRTDSLLHSIIDPNRRSFSTPTTTSPSSLAFPSSKKPNGSSLKINTSIGDSSIGQARKSVAIDSPVGPPPLNRHGPISLPGTPVLMNPPPYAPSTPMSSFDYSSPVVRTPLNHIPVPTTSSLGLVVGTPEQAKSPSKLREVCSALQPESSGSRTRMEELTLPSAAAAVKKTEVDVQGEADEFARKGFIVRQCFSKWRKRRVDVAEWKEACKRSDAYKQKLHESGSGGLAQSLSFKRRRESGEATRIEPARLRRRLRSKVSDPDDPFTDERLVHRLMQNRKENERRWAKGSFIQAIRKQLKTRGEIPQNWTTWLCMNPENDRTAIWLEQKFDVPNSGTWESEAVFSIPVAASPSRDGFPGLIVFECTPLEEITDEIDKKFRVLDDCARLRDILSTLPERRHYIPSLLIVTWDSKSGDGLAPDISQMIAKYVESGVIRSSVTFSIASMDLDLDQAFEKSVASLDLDVVGDLVERLSLEGLTGRLVPSWKEAAFVWLDACGLDDDFDWRLFTVVLQKFVETLDVLLKNVMNAWSPNSVSRMPPLPRLTFDDSADDISVGKSIRQWLSSPMFDQDYLRSNFTAADFSEDFEARAFFEHLLDLAFLYIQRYANGATISRAIPKSTLATSLANFDKVLKESQKSLRQFSRTLPRPRSKREVTSGDISDWGSHASRTSTSPCPQTPANGAKRAGLSLSEEPSQPPSPSPSVAQSTAESTASIVTVSMLRDLARGVLKTYKKSIS